MAKIFKEISRKYFNALKNGVNFDRNLTDFTPNLAACVGEKILFKNTFELGIYTIFDAQKETFLNTTDEFILWNGNFWNEGFAEGDEIKFYSVNASSIILTAKIDTISPDGKIINYTYITGSATGGTGSGLYVNNSYIYVSSAPKGIIYSYGIHENSESFSPFDIVTDSEQAYYLSNITTTLQALQPLGQKRDWVDGESRCKNVSSTNTVVKSGVTIELHEMELEHEFIVPSYVDGQQTNLQNNIIIDDLDGVKSYKHSFKYQLFTNISNPNSAKTFTIDNLQGSVAWFGENFNGFNNPFSFQNSVNTGTDIEYFDPLNGTFADGILVEGTTQIRAIINRSFGTFSSSQYVGVMHKYLAGLGEYTNTISTDKKDNFMYDYVEVLQDGSSSNGAVITNLQSTVLNPTSLYVQFDISYTPDQQAKLSDQSEFLLGFNLADTNVFSADSDRVMMYQYGSYDLSSDIPGLLTVNSLEIFEHDQNLLTDEGFTEMKAENEEEFCTKISFSIDKSKDAYINSISFGLFAHNETTNKNVIIEEVPFNISGEPVNNNVQYFNIDESRGYVFEQGDKFDKKELKYINQAGDIVEYEMTVGQRITWQDWISNSDLPAELFDFTKPNNNLNNKSSNVSLLPDWKVKFGIKANIQGTNSLGVNGDTDYYAFSQEIQVTDYDNHIIQTFDFDTMTDLNGQIQEGKDTLFRITWNGVNWTNGIKCRHRIEVSNDEGSQINMISTHNNQPINDLLKGVTNQIYLDNYAGGGGELITECIIDGSKIQQGVTYNLSGQVDGEANPIPFGVKITEAGVYKKTELGNYKIIE